MVIIKIDELIKELIKARFEYGFKFAEVSILEPFELESGVMSKKSLEFDFSDGYGGCIEGFGLDNIDDFRWDWKYLKEVEYVNNWLKEIEYIKKEQDYFDN